MGTVGNFDEMLRKLVEERGNEETIVHDHGIWSPSNHAIARSCRRQKLTRIVSPRGMLATWSLDRKKHIKKILFKAYQGKDLKSASGFLATGHSEADDIRRLGLTQPIGVIPNGVVFPKSMPPRYRSNPKEVLFLSRIHPKKGLVELIEAWSRLSPSSEWTLVIAGPDEGGYREEMQQLANRLEISDQIKFTGSVSDEEKWHHFRKAEFFILPSASENFGIVIAEALASGLPVITTKGTPWQCLNTEKLGWWVEQTVNELCEAIREAMELSEHEHADLSNRAISFANQNFAWAGIGRRSLEFYKQILAGTLSKGETKDF